MNSSATMEATRSKRACATTKTRGAPGRGTAGTTGPNGSAIMVPSLLPGSLSWEVNRVAPTARPAAPRVSGRARFDVLGCSKPISGRQLAAGLTPAPGSRPDQPLCPSWPAGARPVAWGGRPALVAQLPVDLGEIPAPAAARTRRWTPGRRRLHAAARHCRPRVGGGMLGEITELVLQVGETVGSED